MLKDLVLKNRSYRGYDRSVKMTRDDLVELVELSRLSASSMNRQALKFHIADKEDEVAAIQSLTGWARRLPELNLPYPGTEPTSFIVICVDTSIGAKAAFQRDVGLCAEVMLLGAVEKGFGGCMLGTFKKDALMTLLGLPENIVPDLVVAFGKPAENVVLTSVGEDGETGYYRDPDGKTHYVPKRKLDDILI